MTSINRAWKKAKTRHSGVTETFPALYTPGTREGENINRNLPSEEENNKRHRRNSKFETIPSTFHPSWWEENGNQDFSRANGWLLRLNYVSWVFARHKKKFYRRITGAWRTYINITAKSEKEENGKPISENFQHIKKQLLPHKFQTRLADKFLSRRVDGSRQTEKWRQSCATQILTHIFLYLNVSERQNKSVIKFLLQSHLFLPGSSRRRRMSLF